MVRPPQMKRVLSLLMSTLMLCSVGATGNSAWARDKSSGYAAQMGGQLGLVSVHLSPDGTSLSLEGNRVFTSEETRNFSVLKLPSPYRMLLEIPNAHLATTQTVFPIGRNGVDRVEMSENRSPFYSAVRVVVYVADGQVLSHLNTAFEGNSLKVEGMPMMAQAMPLPPVRPSYNPQRIQPLPPVARPIAAIPVNKVPPVPSAQAPDRLALSPTPQTVLGTPVLPGTNIIQDVYFRDNKLFIQANNGAELRVKNRFTLTSPSRLVLDIDNTVLASKALTNPIAGASDDIEQIRVGQFDENTVRIVIQGNNPEQFETIYTGGDRSLLAVSPYAATSITKLSSNTRLGQVESIDLKRESGGTVLRLSASAPIVHRFLKRDDRVTLDLLNEAANPSAIGFDAKQYPEIAKMRLEPLTEGQPNSKLYISLTNPNVRVVPTLSEDGRVLELLMTTDSMNAAGSVTSILSSLGPAGKAPFPARIVVDAGHGGKDMGANRQGVMEKDLNLAMALLLKDTLEAKGFKVYMTRSTDVFLPLPQITAITNQIHPDLFISIHHNASVNPGLKGIETYYFTPQSIALARRVHVREINNVGARDGGVKQARFYVIHHTDVPAILCEVGYVSNPDELNDLQTMDRKLKAARAIADGVVDYLKTRMSAKAR